jgi:hypothetical protein
MRKRLMILILFTIASVILVSGCTSESGTITTDILDTQNCTLNASLFANANNTVKDDFIVEDTASSADIEFIQDIDPDAYTRTIKNINNGALIGKKTTLAGISGYLVQDVNSKGLEFYFVKDGVTYAMYGNAQSGTSSEITLSNPRGLSVQGAFTDIIEQWNK